MVGIPTIGLFFYNHGVGKPMGMRRAERGK